jgi:hypothetical protein
MKLIRINGDKYLLSGPDFSTLSRSGQGPRVSAAVFDPLGLEVCESLHLDPKDEEPNGKSPAVSGRPNIYTFLADSPRGQALWHRFYRFGRST